MTCIGSSLVCRQFLIGRNSEWNPRCEGLDRAWTGYRDAVAAESLALIEGGVGALHDER